MPQPQLHFYYGELQTFRRLVKFIYYEIKRYFTARLVLLSGADATALSHMAASHLDCKSITSRPEHSSASDSGLCYLNLHPSAHNGTCHEL